MQKKLVRKTTTTVEEFLEDEGGAQAQREDEEDDGREADDADVPAGRGSVVPKSTQNPGRQRIRS
jgi:hypothetical protein